jgi:hypothetical protein
MREHPRWIMDPDAPVEYQGVEAIHCRISDAASPASVSFFVARRDLRLLSALDG